MVLPAARRDFWTHEFTGLHLQVMHCQLQILQVSAWRPHSVLARSDRAGWWTLAVEVPDAFELLARIHRLWRFCSWRSILGQAF